MSRLCYATERNFRRDSRTAGLEGENKPETEYTSRSHFCVTPLLSRSRGEPERVQGRRLATMFTSRCRASYSSFMYSTLTHILSVGSPNWNAPAQGLSEAPCHFGDFNTDYKTVKLTRAG